MAKKKAARPIKGTPVPRLKPLSGRVQKLVEEAAQALERKKYARANELLEEANQREPDHLLILQLLAEVAHEAKDYRTFLSHADHLVRLSPDNPDYLINRAGAYLSNIYPVLALRAFQYVLKRWPHYPQAEEIRQEIARLEPATETFLSEMGYPAPEGWEVGARHEEMQVALALGNYQRVCEMGEKLLQKWPGFAAAYNNMSQAWSKLGKPTEAFAVVRRLLELDPQNVFALANIIIYLCQAGRFEEARTWVDRLTKTPMRLPDWYVKRAEALSFLGEDAAVIESYQQAQSEGALERLTPEYIGMLIHLVATAYARQGDERMARNLWQESIRRYAHLEEAQENLADLNRPPQERSGPFAFKSRHWIPPGVILDLRREVEKSLPKQPSGTERQIILQNHPELLTLAPVLLERGSPDTREFFVYLAGYTRHPGLIEILRQFTFGKTGTRKARNDMLLALHRAAIVPSGLVSMWDGEKWLDVALNAYEIHRDPPAPHPAQVNALEVQALAASLQGNANQAADLYRQAAELLPRDPSLRFKQIDQLRFAGRHQEADEVFNEVIRTHPDYLFGQTELAIRQIRAGQLDEAEKVVVKLDARPRLHVDEFAALMAAHVELSLAKKQLEKARTWIALLEKAHPQSVILPQLREMVRRHE